MHTMTCDCNRCQRARARQVPVPQPGAASGRAPDRPFSAAADPGAPFSEEEELALALELLSVASDEELDLFLGKMVRGIGRGLKKVGRTVRKVARPIGRALKGVAKAALPFVGKALGTFIPIPGVGTAIGGAVGSALSRALEAEFADLEADAQAFEMARAFVRLAGDAAMEVATLADADAPPAVLEAATIDAIRRRVPGLPAERAPAGAASGRWERRGAGIVVLGV